MRLHPLQAGVHLADWDSKDFPPVIEAAEGNCAMPSLGEYLSSHDPRFIDIQGQLITIEDTPKHRRQLEQIGRPRMNNYIINNRGDYPAF